MPYIIDGHNLIPKIRGTSLNDVDDEQRLVEMLQVFCLKQEKTAEVFFDNAQVGGSPVIKAGRVTATFIPSPRTADQAIRQRLKQLGPSVKNYTVVSSDRDVRRSAQEYHARPISSEKFSQLMSESGQNQSMENDEREDATVEIEDIDKWLDLFQRNN
jgi:uncharacterized protein